MTPPYALIRSEILALRYVLMVYMILVTAAITLCPFDFRILRKLN